MVDLYQFQRLGGDQVARWYGRAGFVSQCERLLRAQRLPATRNGGTRHRVDAGALAVPPHLHCYVSHGMGKLALSGQPLGQHGVNYALGRGR